MKKIVFILFFFTPLVKAQVLDTINTNLFVLYNEVKVGVKNQVLNMDGETKKLILIEQDVSTGETYFDSFIIKPTSTDGLKVYIVLARDNNMFLKRTSTGLEFKNINIDTVAENANYEWEIQYSGFPYCAIFQPNTINLISIVNNVPSLVAFDNKGDLYRYKVKKNPNTF